VFVSMITVVTYIQIGVVGVTDVSFMYFKDLYERE